MPVEFRVELPGPLDTASSLELFRRSGDDLIDRWDGRQLIRAVPVGPRRWAPIQAEASGTLESPAFSVVINDDDVEYLEVIRASLARTFMPAPAVDYARLLAEDPKLAMLDARFPGIRQIRQLDVFTALVRCISAQQVNLRWAVTTRRRLAQTFGIRLEVAGQLLYALDPERIAHVDPLAIRALQFTTNKSLSLVAAAQAITQRADLSLEALAQLEDAEVIQRLIRIRGIGNWSAEWVLARTLGRPRVVGGDLGVRKAVGLAYLGTPRPQEVEVHAATAHWGQAAGVAQALLLHALGEGALSALLARSGSPAGSRE